jgi:hypothetical protein
LSTESSAFDQGVPSFEYNPRDYSLRFELSSRPLDALEEQLLNDFAGRTRTLPQIYREHSVGERFIKKNYRQALINLETKGAIEVDPPSPPRKKNTFASHVSASFPAR